MLRLSHCRIENFRALRELDLELDSSTVVIGENGCGKSSLLKALDLCLGRDAPSGGFAFAGTDFHQVPGGGDRGDIRIRLRFSEDGARPDLWTTLRSAGLAKDGGRLDFALQVEVRRDSEPEFSFPGRQLESTPVEVLAEVRRVLPFIRIRPGEQGRPRPMPEGGWTQEELARHQVELEIRAALGELVEADAVPEEAVTAAREALQDVLDRLQSVSGPEPELGVEGRVMAPMSSTGTWSRVAGMLRGSGARSLAVLAFTGGLLRARGPRVLDADARPIISIEEPETSLHPVMLSSVYELIQRLPSQKLITTNSADLLATLPMTCLRRLTRSAAGLATVYQVRAGEMGLDDLRRVAYHLRVRRGTALFMRFWLMVEGETEFWLIPEIARALGFDLRQEGVECLEFAQSGLTPLARLANHLGIGWYLLTDGDRAGHTYAEQADRVAQQGHSRVHLLQEPDIEHCLWAQGYASIYRQAAGLSPGTGMRARPGEIVEKAIRATSKPQLALVLGEAMRAPGSPGVPEPLARIVREAVHWARHGRFSGAEPARESAGGGSSSGRGRNRRRR